MEWKKAKSILIVTFTIVNILLAIVIAVQINKESNQTQLMKDALRVFKTHGIELLVDLPDKTYEMGMLSSETTPPLLEEYKEYTIDNSFAIKNKEEAVLWLQKILDLNAIELNEYRVSEINIKNKRVEYRFVQYYHGLPLFDHTLRLRQNDESVELWNTTIKIKNEVNQKKILPAHHIILKNISDFKNKKIIKMENGYKLETIYLENSTPYLMPTWKISLSDGKEYFFHATTGEKVN